MIESISVKSSDRPPEIIFDEIFQRLHQDIYRLAFHLTQNKEDAEDLFQDVWLQVAKNGAQLGSIRDIKAWVVTIVLNRFRDFLRKKRLRAFVRFGREEIPEPAQKIDRDWQISLTQALSKLSPEQRILFVLKEMEGYKYDEIALLVDKPVGTVKSRMHRIFLRLKKELTDE